MARVALVTGAAAAALAAGLAIWGLSGVRVLPETEASRAALWELLDPAERAAIRSGRVRFLDGREALRLMAAAAKRGRTDKGRPSRGRPALGRRGREFLVILNIPEVFRTSGGQAARGAPPGWEGLPPGGRVLAVTQAAIRLGADLMVDCTAADLARLTPDGWRSVQLAKEEGIWRMVVFDGAHHLPSLAADPELLLVPVLAAGGTPLIAHGYVRDALPLAALRSVLGALGLEPLLVTVPRLSLPLKQALPLGLVVRQALRRLESGAGRRVQSGPGSAAARPGRRVAVEKVAPGHPRSSGTEVLELGWPVSVWDLLLRYPATLAGWPFPWETEEK